MIDIRAGGYHLQELLAAPPKIEDQIDGICRKLDFTLHKHKLSAGTLVELYFNGKREFYGYIVRHRFEDDGKAVYTAYDPLFFVKKYEDDIYIKNQTLTQAYAYLLKQAEVKAGNIANTRQVLPSLWYPAKEGDRALVDMLARQKQMNGKRYLPRFNPVTASADLVELTVPSELWAFQVGVNLTRATYEEDTEGVATVVKLVNRETGKTVTKIDSAAKQKLGKRQKFEEVDKEQAGNMDSLASNLLNNLSKVKITSSVEGINPAGGMPVLFSADLIYVEEKFTGLLGAYHIRNITHTFDGENLITLGMDIQKSPYVQDIQYDNATKNPNED